MADEEELSPDQTEKVLHFQELTGIDDLDRCKELLQQHNWDMEVAVQDTLNEQEGAESVFDEQRPSVREERIPPLDLHPVDQRVYVVNHRMPRGLFGWLLFYFMWPFRFTFDTLWNIFGFAINLLRPDPRTIVTDPLGDVRSFIAQYEQIYGIRHPEFYCGTYSQALNEARRELRFMLVYLHSDSHQDTDFFCRHTLGSRRVMELVNHQMLFWACSVNKPEGYRVSQALKENSYPFLALIVLRDNRMTVVSRIEGPIDANGLMIRLTNLMDAYETSLVAARLEREERSFNQTLREQQDEAYRESLRADQEKERLRRESLEREKQMEQDRLNSKMNEKMRQEAIIRWKEDVRQQLPPEPEADHPDAVKIVLKLPNGIRLERRFYKTDSLQTLYNYVFVHEASPDDFQIVTNFPRRVLPCHPPGEDGDSEPAVTFAEFGLGRSEMLFVHDNEA